MSKRLDAIANWPWVAPRLALLAFAVYWGAGLVQTGTDSHYPIAQAMLQGRLYLTGNYPLLELVPRPGGGWYSPFPPLISVLMLPFAALGLVIDTDLIAAIAGAISVLLMWALMGRIGLERTTRFALTLAWAFGSEVFWVAATGGQHLAPEIVAADLLIGALILGLDRRAPFAAGFCVGLAAAARLPVGLALPLVLWLYRRGGWPLALVGVAIPAAVVAAYNVARFGTPFEFGYGLITDTNGHEVLSESWYQEGIISPAYLSLGLSTMLLRGVELRSQFPWITGSFDGTSVLLTMPILFWIVTARGRLALVCGATAALILLPDLMHGNPGFAQIGYRFIVDALPILWLMLGLAFRNGISRLARAALLIAIPINIWLSTFAWIAIGRGDLS